MHSCRTHRPALHAYVSALTTDEPHSTKHGQSNVSKPPYSTPAWWCRQLLHAMPCHPFGPKSRWTRLDDTLHCSSKPMLYGRVFVSLRQAANHLPYTGLLPKAHGPRSLGGGHARKSSGLNHLQFMRREAYYSYQSKPNLASSACRASHACTKSRVCSTSRTRDLPMKVTFEPGCDFPVAIVEFVCMVTWTFSSATQWTSSTY